MDELSHTFFRKQRQMSNNLSTDKKITAISMLCEGNSIRAIERMIGVYRDTIMRLGVRVGQGCTVLLDDKMKGLAIKQVQVDEMWGCIGAKQKTAKANDMKDCGDIWVRVAIDAETKLVPSFLTGKRDRYHANTFIDDLASRLVGRPQISSDALAAYADAIERAFGSEVDYGTVIKTFTLTDLEATRRYSPPDVLKVKKNARARFARHEALLNVLCRKAESHRSHALPPSEPSDQCVFQEAGEL